jgi:hypothetical protein
VSRAAAMVAVGAGAGSDSATTGGRRVAGTRRDPIGSTLTVTGALDAAWATAGPFGVAPPARPDTSAAADCGNPDGPDPPPAPVGVDLVVRWARLVVCPRAGAVAAPALASGSAERAESGLSAFANPAPWGAASDKPRTNAAVPTCLAIPTVVTADPLESRRGPERRFPRNVSGYRPVGGNISTGS